MKFLILFTILFPILFPLSNAFSKEPVKSTPTPKKFGLREQLVTAVEITVQPTRDDGKETFPAGTPVRVLLDCGKRDILILIGETKEQAQTPRTAIVGGGESDGKPITVMSYQYPDKISYVNKDGPAGIWTGVATGDENIPSSNEALEKEIFRLINLERTQRGLVALVWDEELARAARYQAGDQYTQDYMTASHATYDAIVRPGEPVGRILRDEGDRRIRRFMSTYRSPLGENGQANNKNNSAEIRVAKWMASPGHRANILRGDFRRTGIGYIAGDPSKPNVSGVGFSSGWGFAVQVFTGN